MAKNTCKTWYGIKYLQDIHRLGQNLRAEAILNGECADAERRVCDLPGISRKEPSSSYSYFSGLACFVVFSYQVGH